MLPAAHVMGREANGGLTLGFDAADPAGSIPAPWTRDALPPIVAASAAARDQGVAALVAAELLASWRRACFRGPGDDGAPESTS